MSLTSPNGHRLQRLEGTPGDIHQRGKYLVELGDQMETTATALKRISEGTTQIADSVDALREQAGEWDGELSSAATRYSMTGEVLKTYSSALLTAQMALHPLIDDIETAHSNLQTAQSTQSDATRALDRLNNPLPWEDDPTPTELSRARTTASTASGSVQSAQISLNGLWDSWDTAFGTWEGEYEDAVGGVQQAMDEAGNNDGAWEILDTLIEWAGWVVVALAVVALFVTGPLAILITVIAVAVSAAILIAEIVKMANGRGDWMSLGLAAFGLLTFGMGGAISRLIGKGAPSVNALIRGGRGAVRASVRSTFPPFRFRTPFANIGNWWRTRSIVRGGMERLPILVNPINGLRYGPGYARLNSFNNMVSRNFSNYPGAMNWVSNVGRAAMPGAGQQAVNVGMWTVVTGVGVYGNVR